MTFKTELGNMQLPFSNTIELILIMVALFAFFIYTVYHAVNNPRLYNTQRLIWILIILLATLLGWIAYWGYGKNGYMKR